MFHFINHQFTTLFLYYVVYVCLNISKGQLAASRWRSKFGRPSKLPRLGDVDPTGTYCPMPEDWLKKKFGREQLLKKKKNKNEENINWDH